MTAISYITTPKDMHRFNPHPRLVPIYYSVRSTHV